MSVRRAGRTAVTAACVVACVAAGCSGPAPAAPPRVVSAEQARMDALMRQNASRPSDPQLADDYAAINARYFDGRLPPVRLRWESGLDTIGPLIADGFRLEGLTDGQLILLHPSLEQDPRQLRAVLCHEMVHVALRDRPEAHGPEFQSRLRALADRGAFEGLVATDDEKQALKRTLDTRTADLARDATALRESQVRLEADAPSLAREALQDRIWEYNKRVRQHNEDVDEFNRLVAQYNLMVTYPDGLDRERLARKTGAAEISR